MRGQVVAVTGATGFVGTTVSAALQEAGHRVVALTRRPVPGLEQRPYRLSGPLASDLLAGIDVVVHCAYDLSLTDSRAIAQTNVEGTRALVRSAARADARVILVSSMSAYPGTTQIYGRAKLESEAEVLASGGEAVRLGLVWGGSEGGMIGTLRRLARLPIVPTFGRGLHQFTVHADDMACAFAALLDSPRIGAPLGLANPQAVPFAEIITALAGRRRTFVPVPWKATYAAMRLAEQLGLALPVRADSLLGLVRPAREVPNVGAWAERGVVLREFGASAYAQQPARQVAAW